VYAPTESVAGNYSKGFIHTVDDTDHLFIDLGKSDMSTAPFSIDFQSKKMNAFGFEVYLDMMDSSSGMPITLNVATYDQNNTKRDTISVPLDSYMRSFRGIVSTVQFKKVAFTSSHNYAIGLNVDNFEYILDNCLNDPKKLEPGVCGCGKEDIDSDGDKVLDCKDGCPLDAKKTAPGLCGCGKVDSTLDTDKDNTIDCKDQCPKDPGKINPGVCGCGNKDEDLNYDGIIDCTQLESECTNPSFFLLHPKECKEQLS
jgi:hypothetical protein